MKKILRPIFNMKKTPKKQQEAMFLNKVSLLSHSLGVVHYLSI